MKDFAAIEAFLKDLSKEERGYVELRVQKAAAIAISTTSATRTLLAESFDISDIPVIIMNAAEMVVAAGADDPVAIIPLVAGAAITQLAQNVAVLRETEELVNGFADVMNALDDWRKTAAGETFDPREQLLIAAYDEFVGGEYRGKHVAD